ncbi:MAG: hypothetical protein EA351_09915 [Gemmatimonadales bacterium]|nr:MAG: hypothetical protein EA351_09915 [Gemmatimonadales bacterium]
MSRTSPGTGQLTLVLGFFFVSGAAMALVIWHTLSEFLAGQPVEGGQYLLAMALIGVFVGFAWLMARYIQLVIPPYPSRTDDPDNDEVNR